MDAAVRDIFKVKSLRALLLGLIALLVPYLFWLFALFGTDIEDIVNCLIVGLTVGGTGFFCGVLPALYLYKKRGGNTLKSLLGRTAFWTVAAALVLAVNLSGPAFLISDIAMRTGVYSFVLIVPTLILSLIYWHKIFREDDQPDAYLLLIMLYGVYNLMAFNFPGVMGFA